MLLSSSSLLSVDVIDYSSNSSSDLSYSSRGPGSEILIVIKRLLLGLEPLLIVEYSSSEYSSVNQ